MEILLHDCKRMRLLDMVSWDRRQPVGMLEGMLNVIAINVKRVLIRRTAQSAVWNIKWAELLNSTLLNNTPSESSSSPAKTWKKVEELLGGNRQEEWWWRKETCWERGSQGNRALREEGKYDDDDDEDTKRCMQTNKAYLINNCRWLWAAKIRCQPHRGVITVTTEHKRRPANAEWIIKHFVLILSNGRDATAYLFVSSYSKTFFLIALLKKRARRRYGRTSESEARVLMGEWRCLGS